MQRGHTHIKKLMDLPGIRCSLRLRVVGMRRGFHTIGEVSFVLTIWLHAIIMIESYFRGNGAQLALASVRGRNVSVVSFCAVWCAGKGEAHPQFGSPVLCSNASTLYRGKLIGKNGSRCVLSTLQHIWASPLDTLSFTSKDLNPEGPKPATLPFSP